VKLLVLGGTKFLGRGVVEAALARGHEVTLFNRGVTNPDLYPDAEHLHGDLTNDLDALRGRDWDAAVDLDATQRAGTYVDTLAGGVGHYVFVSTISVYADFSRPVDEESPLLEPSEEYGGLKVASEGAVRTAFGDRAAVVRPGLIVGPHDPTDRFTYWPRRLAAGGDVLAPGSPGRPLQIVDARDLGAWLVAVAEQRTSGVFNATGPAEPLTLGETLDRIGTAVGFDGRLVWVEEQTVLDAGVQPWTELPLWVPGDDYAGLLRADVTRALAAGLAFRPLEETAVDTLAWSRNAGEQRETLSREKEEAILARA
jgi:2'-hydroxyisoflavone reductase